MISYIELYGPPVLKAIKALEKISIEMPEVCIMDTFIEKKLDDFASKQTENSKPHTISDKTSIKEDIRWVMGYFEDIGAITKDRCNNIISDSGISLGEYDFYFDWFITPNSEQIRTLIEKIDKALQPIGCRYRIIIKRKNR